ncbi:MAG: class I SAM-dependent methyltransferase [Halioglobus sp.]|nr:class I SAM-dependent methyltransferase [Halioglobus sp.]
MEEQQYLAALIELHSGLDRLGPGDDAFSRAIIQALPPLPARPRIADIGCGTGAGALILAETWPVTVQAVDFSRTFLDEMLERARRVGLGGSIEAIECDMACLDWPPASLDLLWSEGAAYRLTMGGALRAWRPLLADGGIAVVSEMSYHASPVPPAVEQFMRDVYPDINGEAANVELAIASGFEVLDVRRVPAAAGGDNYYGALARRMDALGEVDDEVMRAVIDDCRHEMDFFRLHCDHYGYTFFILRAV